MKVRLLLLALLLLPGTAGAGPSEDLGALLDDVESVVVTGVPGALTVTGERAFPVLAGELSGRLPVPVAAAARYGEGRVVAFSHEGFLGPDANARFVANSLRWAAGGPERPRLGVLGDPALLARLAEAGFEVVELAGARWAEVLGRLDVVCGRVTDLDRSGVVALGRWLRSGGGLVTGFPGWGWQQLNEGKDLATENPANRLLAPAGIVWGRGHISVPPDGRLRADAPPPALTHAGRALDALLAETTLSRAERDLAVATLTRAVGDLPPDDETLLARLDRLLAGPAGRRVVPSERAPLVSEPGIGRVLLALQIERNRRMAPEEVRAHPAAARFPGAVPDGAKRVREELTLDTRVPGWRSTGLYVAPGNLLSVRVPKEAVGAGLALRIGAHTDLLWRKERWYRAPEITRVFPIESEVTKAASAFGGPVYLEVPPGLAPAELDVTISGAVPAPHYVLGRTSLAEWRDSIRGRAAPWGELETGKVVITVPSRVLRGLDDPEALMEWWDRVMDACADLAAIPRERERPQRIVADAQTVVGYMHAGNPIVTHLDAAERLVDLGYLATKGDWGLFHELGHQHQRPEWTFEGAVEVTCNLFSLHLMETVCTEPAFHRAFTPEVTRRDELRYVAGGRRFDDWKRKPFLALIMYVQLKDAFGWDAYRKVFAEYRGLTRGELPRSDDEKRDQWLVRFSRAVGRNLGPFFEHWGIPVSERARAAVANLPAWMPKRPHGATDRR